MKDACYFNGLLHALQGNATPPTIFKINKIRLHFVNDIGFQDGNRLNVRY